jgi:protein-tyrosine phosphatase
VSDETPEPARIISCPHDHQWVHRRVALGSAPWSERDVASLRAAGVTHVLNVSSTSLAYLYRGTPIQEYYVPTEDDRRPKPPEWFWKGIAAARTALGLSDGKLLVHCAAGVHRSPAMAYAVLRAVLGVGPSDAWGCIRRARPQARPLYLKWAEHAVRQPECL